MIKTEFDSDFDPEAIVPAGSRLGIIACADCCSAYRTGDTGTIDRLTEQLKGHCVIEYALSVSSPCDQRGLRLWLSTRPQIWEADYILLLSCAAGRTSLLGLLESPTESKSAPRVFSPVLTRDFSYIGRDGTSRRACLFCRECRFDEFRALTGQNSCPLALCPLGRGDGPCQNRVDNSCIMSPEMKCSWMGGPGDRRLSSPEIRDILKTLHRSSGWLSGSAKSEKRLFGILPTGLALDQINEICTVLSNAQEPVTLLLDGQDGISPFALLPLLKQNFPVLDFGICTDSFSFDSHAVERELFTSSQLGVSYVLLRDRSYQQTDRPPGSSMHSLQTLSEFSRFSSMTPLVFSSLQCVADEKLLFLQAEFGAKLLISEDFSEAPDNWHYRFRDFR